MAVSTVTVCPAFSAAPGLGRALLPGGASTVPENGARRRAEVPGRGITDGFDGIVCAGNVMTFCAPSTRPLVLEGMAAHLHPRGRAVVGFGRGRDYDFEEFLEHADSAGLVPDHLLSTWDLRPFGEDSDFLVAVLARA